MDQRDIAHHRIVPCPIKYIVCKLGGVTWEGGQSGFRKRGLGDEHLHCGPLVWLWFFFFLLKKLSLLVLFYHCYIFLCFQLLNRSYFNNKFYFDSSPCFTRTGLISRKVEWVAEWCFISNWAQNHDSILNYFLKF